MNVYIYNIGIHGSLSSWKNVPVIAESKEQADELVRESYPIEEINYIDRYNNAVQKPVEPVIKEQDFKKKVATTFETEDSFGCAVKVTAITDKHLNGKDLEQYIKTNWPGTESYHILSRANVIEML